MCLKVSLSCAESWLYKVCILTEQALSSSYITVSCLVVRFGAGIGPELTQTHLFPQERRAGEG